MSALFTGQLWRHDLPDDSRESVWVTLAALPHRATAPTALGALLREGCEDAPLVLEGTCAGRLYELRCGIEDTTWTLTLSADSTTLQGEWRSAHGASGGVLLLRATAKHEHTTAVWCGEAMPGPEHANEVVNPIQWQLSVLALQRVVFGAGFFDDSADVPGKPVLFFTLSGRIEEGAVTLSKRYEAPLDYFSVDYQGHLVDGQLRGRWVNHDSGVQGVFSAQPTAVDGNTIALCATCHCALFPGTKRYVQPNDDRSCERCGPVSTRVEYADTLPDTLRGDLPSCASIVHAALHAYANRVLFVGPEGSREPATYGRVASIAAQLQHRLVVRAGDAVVVQADTNSVQWFAWMCALLLQGAVVVPLPSSLETAVVERIVAALHPAALLGVSLPLRATVPWHVDQDDVPASGPPALVARAPLCDNVVAILYSSGTTGDPKGVRFTEALCLPSSAVPTFLPCVKVEVQPYDPTAVLSLVALMRCGGTQAFVPLDHFMERAGRLLPTHLALPCALWTAMHKQFLADCSNPAFTPAVCVARARERVGPRVMHASCGGTGISAAVVAWVRRVLGVRLACIYGCREVGTIAVDEVVASGVTVRVRLEHDQSLATQGRGEILVHSPSLARYQVDCPGAVFEDHGRAWFCTGDVGVLETDGATQRVRVEDRVGFAFKDAAGEWVSPALLEQALEAALCQQAFVFSHDGVVAAVLVNPTERNGSSLLSAVALTCSRVGLTRSVPRKVFAESESWTAENGLLTSSLKKKRRLLVAKYAAVTAWLIADGGAPVPSSSSSSSSSSSVRAPARALDSRLVSALRAAGLPVDASSSTTPFSALAASSVEVAAVLHQLRERGVAHLRVGDLFRSESLAQLSFLIESAQSFGDEPLEYWQQQLSARFALQVPHIPQESVRSGRACVLLGATGHLGTHLLRALLGHFETVVCIVRRSRDVAPHARVVCFVGDATEPLLGVSVDQWRTIRALGAAVLICNAAHVDYSLPFAALHRVNVDGPLEAARVALALDCALWFVSSIAAATSSGLSVSAQQLTGSPASGYAKSKVIAEALLQRVPSLRLGIIRPGALGPHSVSGRFNAKDMHAVMLLRSVQARAVPAIALDDALPLKWLPVDTAADCMARLVAERTLPRDGAPAIVNMVGDAAPTTAALFTAIAQRLGVTERLDVAEWKRRIARPDDGAAVSAWLADVKLQGGASPDAAGPRDETLRVPFDQDTMIAPLVSALVEAAAPPEALIPVTLTLPELLVRLRTWDPDIDSRLLNVYQLGSRVYGTAHAKSDWDFMCVVEHTKGLTNGYFLWECFDDGAVNCALYSLESFQHMLAAQRLEAIECVCLAPQFVWLERVVLRYRPDPMVLCKMGRWIARQRLQMGQKRFGNEGYKARKCIFHAYRYLVFVEQLLAHGRIVDYAAANELLAQVQGDPGTTWDQVHASFAARLDERLKRLKFGLGEAGEGATLESKHDFWMRCALRLRHQRVRGPLALPLTWLNMAGGAEVFVASTQHAGDLVHVSVARHEARAKCRHLGRFGAVVSVEAGAVVAHGGPLPVLVTHEDLAMWSGDARPNTVHVFAKLSGVPVMLYHHRGQWKVASALDADGLVETTASSGQSVSELFWSLFGSWTRPVDTSVCYSFVMQHPTLRRIVRCRPSLFLVRAVRLNDGASLPVWRVAAQLGWTCAPLYENARSRKDAFELLRTMRNPFLDGAGLVVVDAATHVHYELPSSEYVSVSCTDSRRNFGFGPLGNMEADHLERADLVLLFRLGQGELFAARFADKWRIQLEEARLEWEAQRDALQRQYDDLTLRATHKKELAALAGKSPDKRMLFAMFDGWARDAHEALLLYGNDK